MTQVIAMGSGWGVRATAKTPTRTAYGRATSDLVTWLRTDPDTLAQMREVLTAGLKAEKYDRFASAPVEDHKVRGEFLKIALAYSEGLPIQRSEVHSVSWNGLKEIEARVAGGHWPAMEAAIAEIVEEDRKLAEKTLKK